MKAFVKQQKTRWRKFKASSQNFRRILYLGLFMLMLILIPQVIAFLVNTNASLFSGRPRSREKNHRPIPVPSRYSNTTANVSRSEKSCSLINKQVSVVRHFQTQPQAHPPQLHLFKHFCKNPGFTIINNSPKLRVDLLPGGLVKPLDPNFTPEAITRYEFLPLSCANNKCEKSCIRELEINRQYRSHYWDRSNLHYKKSPEAGRVFNTFSKKFNLSKADNLYQSSSLIFEPTVNHPDLIEKFRIIEYSFHLLYLKSGACGYFKSLSAIRILAQFKEKSPQMNTFLIRKYFAADAHQFLGLQTALKTGNVQKPNITNFLSRITGYFCDAWNKDYFRAVNRNEIRMYNDGDFLDEIEVRNLAWEYDWSAYTTEDKADYQAYNNRLNQLILKVANYFKLETLGTEGTEEIETSPREQSLRPL